MVTPVCARKGRRIAIVHACKVIGVELNTTRSRWWPPLAVDVNIGGDQPS